MNITSSGGEYIAAAGRAAPPLAVTGSAIAGASLQDWVYILTILYTALQIAAILWKFVKDKRDTD